MSGIRSRSAPTSASPPHATSRRRPTCSRPRLEARRGRAVGSHPAARGRVARSTSGPRSSTRTSRRRSVSSATAPPSSMSSSPHSTPPGERAGPGRALRGDRAETLAAAPETVALAEVIAAALPADAIVAGDSSQIAYWGSRTCCPSGTPHSLLYTPTYATLGYGCPPRSAPAWRDRAPGRLRDRRRCAHVLRQRAHHSGGAGARPHRRLVDNGGYAEIRQNEVDRGIRPIGVDLVQPDWVALAHAFGATGRRAESAPQVTDAVRAAIAARGCSSCGRAPDRLTDTPATSDHRDERNAMTDNIGPVDASANPRYAGLATFARLPRIEDVRARGHRRRGRPVRRRRQLPAGRAVRSRARARIVEPAAAVQPRAGRVAVRGGQVADCRRHRGEPVRHRARRSPIERPPRDLGSRARASSPSAATTPSRCPLLRAVARRARPGRGAALRRPPRHLGHLFRRAVHARHAVPPRRRGGAARPRPRCHVGIRGPLYSPATSRTTRASASRIVHSVRHRGRHGVADSDRAHAATASATGPVYISIDIDVLDPAHAPGTGTPEAGGMTSRELLRMLRGLAA